MAEPCRLVDCSESATHKVGEEMPPHQMRRFHNLTSWLCCEHFKAVFGHRSCYLVETRPSAVGAEGE